MNWKLIFQLSLFGLIMAFGTVWLITKPIMEFPFWLAIFIFCAYIIAARTTSRYFLTGFMVSLVNCFWILLIHCLLFRTYMHNNPEIATDSKQFPGMQNHPRVLMLIFGPIFGIVSGIVLGLFAFIASKIVKKPTPEIPV